MFELIRFETNSSWFKRFVISTIVEIVVLCFFLICQLLLTQTYTFTISPDQSKTIRGTTVISRNMDIAKVFEGKELNDSLLGEFNNYVNRNLFLKDGVAISQTEKVEIISDAHMNIFGTTTQRFFKLVSNYLNDLSSQNIIYAYTDNWSTLTSMFNLIGIITPFCLVLSFSSIFSGSAVTNPNGIIHSTKHGRSKLTIAKFILSLLCSLLLIIAILSIATTFVVVFWGDNNPTADIRLFTNGAFLSYPQFLSCIDFVLISALMCFLSAIQITCQTLIVSSLFKSARISFALNICLSYLPLLISAQSTLTRYFPINISQLTSNSTALSATNPLLLCIETVILLIVSLLITLFVINSKKEYN